MTARTLQIPADLDQWHPNEITGWLSAVEDNETASDDDVNHARQAVNAALGVD